MSNWKQEQKHEERLREKRFVARQLCLDGDHEWVVDDVDFVPSEGHLSIFIVCQRCIYSGRKGPEFWLPVSFGEEDSDFIREKHAEWKEGGAE